MGSWKHLQVSQDAQVSCLPGMWDFSAETGTVPGKQGQLVNVNVHKRLCVSQVLFD